jgi:hypothetical protein
MCHFCLEVKLVDGWDPVRYYIVFGDDTTRHGVYIGDT